MWGTFPGTGLVTLSFAISSMYANTEPGYNYTTLPANHTMNILPLPTAITCNSSTVNTSSVVDCQLDHSQPGVFGPVLDVNLTGAGANGSFVIPNNGRVAVDYTSPSRYTTFSITTGTTEGPLTVTGYIWIPSQMMNYNSAPLANSGCAPPKISVSTDGRI